MNQPDWLGRDTRQDPPEVRAYVSSGDHSRRLEAHLVSWTNVKMICAVEPGARAPAAVGDDVTLWLVLGSPRIERALPARLTLRRDEQSRTTLHFDLTDPASVRELLKQPQLRAIDRRLSIRTRASGPITLIADGAPPEVGTLLDISTGGLAVEVGPAFEDRMIGRDQVECVFRLPGLDLPLSLEALIRSRTLTSAGRVRYGLMFREDDDGVLRAARGAIAAWQATG